MPTQKKIKPLPAELKPAIEGGSFDNKHERDKLVKRRIAWRWNKRLLIVSIPIMLLFLGGGLASYRYHSSIIGGTFLSRAKVAEAEQNYVEQLKWLDRYSMLEPEDVDSVVNVALAANKMADFAQFEDRYRATQIARKHIGDAIGRLGTKGSDEKAELRKLLINRLLQSGSYRYRKAEQNIVSLSAPDHDPDATRWMALALVGQVNQGIYEQRLKANIPQGAGHWRRLSYEKPGEVLFEALRHSPRDVYLLQNLVALAHEHPELFEYKDGGDTEAQRLVLQGRVEERLRAIEGNQDSRSRVVIFNFEKNCGRSLIASRKLESVAEAVKQRLEEAEQTPNGVWNSKVGQSPPVFWDHLLLAQVAMNLNEQNPDLAKSYYDVLNQVESKWIPKSYRETEYLLAGRLAFQQEDVAEALRVFQQGVEAMPDSIRLRGAIAQISLDLQRRHAADPTAVQSEFPKPEEALEDYRQAIKENFLKLSSPKKGQAMNATRAELGSQIEIARWRINVLEAKFEAIDGQINKAIEKLDFALNAQIEIDPDERVSVALELADLHKRNGTMDLTALALERAIEITPGNLKIRALAADAWRQSRHFERASKQWRVVGKRPLNVDERSDIESLAGRISSCELRYNDQFKRSTSERDFSGLRIWIKELEEDIQLASTVLEDSFRERLSEIESRLAILNASMPPLGAVELDDSEKNWSKLESLAIQRKDDPRFQAFTAIRFASAQRHLQARQALERLSQTAGSDSIETLTIGASLEAAQGNPLKAARMLQEFAKQSQDSSEAERVLKLSAEYALSGGDRELAYQILESSPVHKLSSLFTLCKIANNLSPESSIVKNSNKTVEALQSHWYQKLRDAEGESGTLWRFIDAKVKVVNLLSRSNQIKPDDAELVEARTLVDQIIEHRPRWGAGISLEGWLYAAEGKPEAAVERIRMGITAGDLTLQSRDLLIKLLLKLDRVDEAEVEIISARNKTNGEFDSDSRGLILVEQKRGDFIKSSQISLLAALSKPDDLMAQIVCAQTAIVAVKNLSEEAQKQEQIKVAEQAIERAKELTQGDHALVLSSILSLQLAKGDRAEVKRVIETIDASDLKPRRPSAL